MINYQLLPDDPITGQKSTFIKKLPDNLFIPMNPDNTDYQAYLAWVAKGNTPLPAEQTA